MNELNIVHVDDSGNVLSLMKEFIENGFKSKDRVVSLRQEKNFKGVEQDIATGNLAHVYILDNEITGGDKEGAEIAQEIYDKAETEGRKVIVINLLSSNPEGVMDLYGEELRNRDIPVLNKITEAHLCFFYIGDCLNRLIKGENKLPFEGWLKENGIRRIEEGNLAREKILSLVKIQRRLQAFITIRAEGAFWTPEGDFINMNRRTIEGKMDSQGIEAMNEMFPVGTDGLETKA